MTDNQDEIIKLRAKLNQANEEIQVLKGMLFEAQRATFELLNG